MSKRDYSSIQSRINTNLKGLSHKFMKAEDSSDEGVDIGSSARQYESVKLPKINR